mmetsp:Transcript_72088/g.120938  ORF Transcript_72088/g.120938 Transcript_72088/m.120938 type:complete len:128 (+) Transcript_72088:637-1020(+)
MGLTDHRVRAWAVAWESTHATCTPHIGACYGNPFDGINIGMNIFVVWNQGTDASTCSVHSHHENKWMNHPKYSPPNMKSTILPTTSQLQPNDMPRKLRAAPSKECLGPCACLVHNQGKTDRAPRHMQ